MRGSLGALGLAVLLSGCSTLGLAPQEPIIPLAASGAPTPADERLEDTDLCWAMLQDLPVMDDSGLDPANAEFFRAWGLYMRDVDRYLNQRIPLLEALIEQAPAAEQPSMDVAMEGILRMRAAVHGAARRLMAAEEPVDMALMRAFTVASTDFLDGLDQACPGSGLVEAGSQQGGLSMT